MGIVIPAAGLGTRFLPLTRAVPKEMLVLGSWPLIHHALLEAQRARFDQAIVVISPSKAAIRRYFEPDSELDWQLEARGDRATLERVRAVRRLAEEMKVTFVERDTKGPGHAVLLARDLVGGDRFGVLLPDDVVPGTDHWHALRSAVDETGAGALCVRPVPIEEISRFGIAVCAPEWGRLRVRRLIEKPAAAVDGSTLAVFGRYIVTSPVIAALEARLDRVDGELHLIDGFAAVLGESPGVRAVHFSGESYDCGTPMEYARSAARYPVDEPLLAWAGRH
jgi:UTP--glucose-1-phosphate uridylyltransferase